MSKSLRLASTLLWRRFKHCCLRTPQRELARAHLRKHASMARARFANSMARYCQTTADLLLAAIDSAKAAEDKSGALATLYAREETIMPRTRVSRAANRIFRIAEMNDALAVAILPAFRRRYVLIGLTSTSPAIVAVADLAPRLTPSCGAPAAERLLVQMSSLLPRRYRDGFVGDLHEDLEEYRNEHLWSERRLLLHVILQTSILYRHHLARLLRWGIVSWLAVKFRNWLQGSS